MDPAFQFIQVDSCESTNTLLADLSKNQAVPEWTVVQAQYQTKGKGYHSNSWFSDHGKNLLFSILLKPHWLAPANQFQISQAVSLGIIDFLSGFEKGFTIKWPNDIYFETKKIAGILIENAFSGNRFDSSIIGIGLNLNQLDFPDSLPNPVSLAQICKRSLNRDEQFKDLLDGLYRRISALIDVNYEELKQEYLSNLFLYGQESRFRIDELVKVGVIRDVDSFGRLLVQFNDGTQKHFGFKEIEYLF